MWWSPTPTTLTLPQILPKSPRYPPQRHLHTLSSWWNAQPPTEFGNQKPWSKLRICSTPQTVYLDSWESLQSPASSSTCNSSSSSSSLAMMSRWLWRILQVVVIWAGDIGDYGCIGGIDTGMMSQWEAIQEGRRDWWTASTPRFLPGGRRLVVVDREETPILEGLLVCTRAARPCNMGASFLTSTHHRIFSVHSFMWALKSNNIPMGCPNQPCLCMETQIKLYEFAPGRGIPWSYSHSRHERMHTLLNNVMHLLHQWSFLPIMRGVENLLHRVEGPITDRFCAKFEKYKAVQNFPECVKIEIMRTAVFW